VIRPCDTSVPASTFSKDRYERSGATDVTSEDVYTMACDKGHIRHCIPLVFRIKRSVAKVAEMIYRALGESAVTHSQKLIQEVSRERL